MIFQRTKKTNTFTHSQKLEPANWSPSAKSVTNNQIKSNFTKSCTTNTFFTLFLILFSQTDNLGFLTLHFKIFFSDFHPPNQLSVNEENFISGAPSI